MLRCGAGVGLQEGAVISIATVKVRFHGNDSNSVLSRLRWWLLALLAGTPATAPATNDDSNNNQLLPLLLLLLLPPPPPITGGKDFQVTSAYPEPWTPFQEWLFLVSRAAATRRNYISSEYSTCHLKHHIRVIGSLP